MANPTKDIELIQGRCNIYLNDSYIFIESVRPSLKEKADVLKKNKSGVRKRYDILSSNVEKGKNSSVLRSDEQVGQVYHAYWERGIFETHIVSMVSRFESALQESVLVAIKRDLKKLKVIADEKKANVPLEMIIEADDRDALIERYVTDRCEYLMYQAPSQYLEKSRQVLGVPIDKHLMDAYVEIKASRDIIIHNRGEINSVYVLKAGANARGKEGYELVVDEAYFQHVILTLKKIVGSIVRGVRKKAE